MVSVALTAGLFSAVNILSSYLLIVIQLMRYALSIEFKSILIKGCSDV